MPLGNTIVEDGFGECADGVASADLFMFAAGLLPRQLTTSTMLLLFSVPHFISERFRLLSKKRYPINGRMERPEDLSLLA